MVIILAVITAKPNKLQPCKWRSSQDGYFYLQLSNHFNKMSLYQASETVDLQIVMFWAVLKINRLLILVIHDKIRKIFGTIFQKNLMIVYLLQAPLCPLLLRDYYLFSREFCTRSIILWPDIYQNRAGQAADIQPDIIHGLLHFIWMEHIRRRKARVEVSQN